MNAFDDSALPERAEPERRAAPARGEQTARSSHAGHAAGQAGQAGPGQHARLSTFPMAGGALPEFRAVYDEHFAFVWRCAANRGVRGAMLDDVVQEVFIVVHRKLAEFEGRSSLRTWLAAIVRRVVSDYLHKRGNQPAGDQPLEREPSLGASPADELERKAAVALLDALLAKMSEDQREVFVLHEIEHLSGPEIAVLTASNENTVWTRLRAARRTFQEGVNRERARHSRERS